jgi:DNA-binding transcriptional ArsR family regulator
MELPANPELAGVAGMIGHPARAAMLSALLRGEAMTSGALARCAGVAAATASEHLARLVEHGLVTRRAAGRCRYYELAGADVAAALEALARVANKSKVEGRSFPEYERALRFARTCYDHLAGRVGVMLHDVLLERALIVPSASDTTGEGDAWLTALGIDVDGLRRGRRAFLRPCLDWSERRDHVAGAVGAAITAAMLERRWVVRMPDTRAVRLTLRGREGLYRVLGLEMQVWDRVGR